MDNKQKNSIKSTKKRLRKSNIIIILAIIVVAFFTVNAFFSLFDNAHLDINQAEETTLHISTDCQIVVIRNEAIQYAPEYGDFIASEEQGKKVKEGGIIGNMAPGEEKEQPHVALSRSMLPMVVWFIMILMVGKMSWIQMS